jgi:ribosome-binding ATPase YchF (GTP1/OBG family)
MDFGLIGLGRSGKTTVFDVLTGGHVPTGTYETGGPHVGVVKLPDSRLDELAAHFKPKKSTHADVRYLDFPGAAFAKGFGREGASAEVLTALARGDALIHVVRAFRSERVPHPEGSVDPHRDVATMDLELAFADLAFVQKRLERLDIAVRSAKAGERAAGEKEMALLERIKAGLEAETPLRAQTLSPDERRALHDYDLLTAKPMLLLLNIDEADVSRSDELETEFRRRWAGPHRDVAALCAKIELELGELSEEEAAEFRADLGVPESGRDLVIRRSFELLGLLSFFTVNPGVGGAGRPHGARRRRQGPQRHGARFHPSGGPRLARAAGFRLPGRSPQAGDPASGGQAVRGAGRRRLAHSVQRLGAMRWKAWRPG